MADYAQIRRVLWCAVVVLVIAVLLCGVWFAIYPYRLGNAYWGDYTYWQYLERLGLPEDITYGDLIDQGYEGDGDNSYRRVYLNGYTLGFSGFTDRPCAIFLESENAPRILRDDIGVGDPLKRLLRAYPDAHTMRGENSEPCGIILSEHTGNSIFAGVWIHYEVDENGIIKELSVTNGF